MEVKINREIRNYSESVFFGLSMRQCIFSFLFVHAAANIAAAISKSNFVVFILSFFSY